MKKRGVCDKKKCNNKKMEKEEKLRGETCSDRQCTTEGHNVRGPVAVTLGWSVSFFSKDGMTIFFVLGPVLCAGCRKIEPSHIAYGNTQ